MRSDQALETGQTADGIRIAVQPDRALPIVAVALQLRTGSVDDPPQRPGLAHVAEHLAYRQLRRDLAAHTSTVQAMTTRDRTQFSAVLCTLGRSAAEVAAAAVAAMSALVTMAHALPRWLDRERAVIAEERAGRGCRRGGRDDAPLFAAFFPPGHPYRHPPIGEPAAEASPVDAIERFLTDTYTAGRAHLAVVGDVDPERVLAGPAPSGPVPRRDVPQVGRRAALVPGEPTVLACAGPPSGADGFAALCLAAHVLPVRPAVLGLLDHPSPVVWSLPAAAVARLPAVLDEAMDEEALAARCAAARGRLAVTEAGGLLSVHDRATRLVHAGAGLGDPRLAIGRGGELASVPDDAVRAAIADLRAAVVPALCETQQPGAQRSGVWPAALVVAG